jgi:hypothetical protein
MTGALRRQGRPRRRSGHRSGRERGFEHRVHDRPGAWSRSVKTDNKGETPTGDRVLVDHATEALATMRLACGGILRAAPCLMTQIGSVDSLIREARHGPNGAASSRQTGTT